MRLTRRSSNTDFRGDNSEGRSDATGQRGRLPPGDPAPTVRGRGMKAVVTVAATLGVLGLSACGSLTTPATRAPATTTRAPASATPTPTPSGPTPTADDILCAQALVVAMRAGLDHSVINSANVTAAQQQAEAGLTVCQPVISKHGEGLDRAVWDLTAQAGFHRSRWDQ
jgi:hypothetical protein